MPTKLKFGEWGEQMKVKIVEYSEDFKVKVVADSGPCLLSTACVEAFRLRDDSSELSTVREFRDTIIRSLTDQRGKIR